MYDASQGANSGAHISELQNRVLTCCYGELYEKFQNSDMNAAPFFYSASPLLTTKDLSRNNISIMKCFGVHWSQWLTSLLSLGVSML